MTERKWLKEKSLHNVLRRMPKYLKNQTEKTPKCDDMYYYMYLVTLDDGSQWVLHHTEKEKKYLYQIWSNNCGDGYASEMFDYMVLTNSVIQNIEDIDISDMDLDEDYEYWKNECFKAMFEHAGELIDDGSWIYNYGTLKDRVAQISA